uniref:Saposin B-type domain-containing protein n=1 Tax=Panagrolaimus sp. JU765 TaxID=591449 RepID=A0AC34RJ30_9BILA
MSSCLMTEDLIKHQTQFSEKYPQLFCTICRGLGNGNCRDCPFLEDIPVCELIEQYETFTNGKVDIHEGKKMFPHLTGNCTTSADQPTLGQILAQMDDTGTSWGQCIICNLVLGLVLFLQNDIVLSPGFDNALSGVCTLINNCDQNLVDAVIQGLAVSVQQFYNIIGVDIIGCPSYPDFVNNCFGA